MTGVLLKRCECGRLCRVGSLRDSTTCHCGETVRFIVSNLEIPQSIHTLKDAQRPEQLRQIRLRFP